jgi:hypothetical protein
MTKSLTLQDLQELRKKIKLLREQCRQAESGACVPTPAAQRAHALLASLEEAVTLHSQAKWSKTKPKSAIGLKLLAVHCLLPGNDDETGIEEFIAERVSSHVTLIEKLIEDARKSAF